LEATASIIFVLIFLAILAFLLVAYWKIFEKAGQPGWAALIPIYNIYILTKIIGKPGYWTLLMLIPFVSVVFAIWGTNLLSKSFGKDEGFTVGLILLGFVFIPILGFGASKYIGAQSSEALQAKNLNSISQ
jgi:ABC-type phosphate transport system permease subunit